MTPDDVLNLLTAAVDGELTPAEATVVRGLLADSPATRALFRRLKADRQRLRAVPPVPPPADLHARIMARIPAAAPAPAEPRRYTAPPRRASFVPVAVAAGVMLAVMGGSFTYFMSQPHVGGNGAHVAAKTATPTDRQLAQTLPRENDPPPSVPAATEPPARGAYVVAVETPAAPEIAPEPRPVVRDVVAFPPLPDAIGKLDLARVRVPFLAFVAEFDRDEVRQQFLAELAHDPAYRIDLFARDPAKGTELFQAAAKAAGLTVHADKATADRVQRKQAAAYVLYTESLTAAELGELMARLSAADGKAAYRAFDAVHATPATPADQRDLRDVMGTDPGLWKRPAVTTDPKSVSSGTGERISRTLTDPASKGSEKSAVLLTFAPTQVRTPPGASRELRQFLDRRGDRRPNAVPVLIVIRQSAG